MSDTFLKEIAGHRVYVTDDGRFTVTVGQNDITRKTLKDLEREITKRTAVRIPVILVNISHPQEVRQVVVVSCEENRFRTDGGELRHQYEPLYHCDAELCRQLSALYEEYSTIVNQLTLRWQAVTARLQRLLPGEWTELVKQYQTPKGLQEDVSKESEP